MTSREVWLLSIGVEVFSSICGIIKNGVSRRVLSPKTEDSGLIFAIDDTEVRKNNLNPAFISWWALIIGCRLQHLYCAFRYFTLAHEIAHNLVQPHNSEHEFYFSALCEKHIMKLGSLLSGWNLVLAYAVGSKYISHEISFCRRSTHSKNGRVLLFTHSQFTEYVPSMTRCSSLTWN